MSLKGLYKPLLLGLAIRELLAPWTGHPFDFEIWVRLGAYIQTGASPYSILPYYQGISFAPYSVMTSISYPPLSALIFGAIFDLYRTLGSPSGFLYYFLLKQPLVISDLLISVLLFRLISLKGETGRARKVAILWIFLPFTIIVSSMWGALDPLALFLILASVYALETERPMLSAGLLGLSIYLKLMPIIFLPLFLFRPIPMTKRVAFAAVSLGIPAVGTLAPFLSLGWSFSGIFNAVSYQGALPTFGGISLFNALSLFVTRGSLLTQGLGWAWLPVLLAFYAFAFYKKIGLIESLLVTILLFSIFRSVVPEQWALYPIAFLLLTYDGRSLTRVWAIAGIATAFLLVNNVLLVRFFSPVSAAAFSWDLFVDNVSLFSVFRYALLFIISTLFVAESFSIILRRNSFILSKLEALRRIRPRELLVPLAYLAVVSVSGGLLDFAATSMITNWALAIQSNVFLGMSWLSLYHIMLVAVFEILVVLVVVFSRRNLSESIGLFLLLTFLNFVASSLSLVLYRSLEGAPVFATTTIYLANSALVTERAFVVFAATLGALGIFYLGEIRAFFLIALRRTTKTGDNPRREELIADSLPAVA